MSDLTKCLHNDVVDRDVNQLDEKADKSHDGKANCRCHGDLLKLFAIRLRASLDKSDGVLGKLPAGLDERHYLVHGFGVSD